MRLLIMLLLATILFACLVSGTALNLLLIWHKIAGTVVLTEQVIWQLIAVGTGVACGLLWLFVKVGAKE